MDITKAIIIVRVIFYKRQSSQLLEYLFFYNLYTHGYFDLYFMHNSIVNLLELLTLSVEILYLLFKSFIKKNL